MCLRKNAVKKGQRNLARTADLTNRRVVGQFKLPSGRTTPHAVIGSTASLLSVVFASVLASTVALIFRIVTLALTDRDTAIERPSSPALTQAQFNGLPAGRRR
jgi:hypothetical protein